MAIPRPALPLHLERLAGRGAPGEGHAFKPEDAIVQAQELVGPEAIDHLDVDYRGRVGSTPSARPGAPSSDVSI